MTKPEVTIEDGFELRALGTRDHFEVRVDARKGTIEGHAAVFNQRSVDLGGFLEEIDPKAFDDTLTADVRALQNHDANRVLGRTKSDTLELWTDSTGLGFRAIPPSAQWARDLRESIERGDIDQGSFQFMVPKGGEHWYTEGRQAIRRLLSVVLRDVSVVTFGAYPQTAVAARSFELYQRREAVLTPYADRVRRRELELLAESRGLGEPRPNDPETRGE